MRLGYACINLALATRVRTCRLANATPERVAELARENLATLRRVAEWNRAKGVRLFRVSSDLVPFAGLDVGRLQARDRTELGSVRVARREDVASGWRDALADDFRETGETFRRHDQRVSAHPGQYTVLNSPRPDVVAAAVRDLEAQASYFDLMGVHGDLVVHVGGVFGDREAALGRFVDAARAIPDTVRKKLVVENDDRSWPIADVLRVSDETGFPVVFDALHHAVLPSPGFEARDALAAALDTWPTERTPKVHYSDQDPDRRPGAHDRLVDVERFREWLHSVRGLRDFDVMVEAKGKDDAVLPLVPVLEEVCGEAPLA